jgi:hypothetical protein
VTTATTLPDVQIVCAQNTGKPIDDLVHDHSWLAKCTISGSSTINVLTPDKVSFAWPLGSWVLKLPSGHIRPISGEDFLELFALPE